MHQCFRCVVCPQQFSISSLGYTQHTPQYYSLYSKCEGSHESVLFQYCEHVIMYSGQCELETRNCVDYSGSLNQTQANYSLDQINGVPPMGLPLCVHSRLCHPLHCYRRSVLWATEQKPQTAQLVGSGCTASVLGSCSMASQHPM